MKSPLERIIYTQRVEIAASYGERRDCTDIRIPKFLAACGFLPIPAPNAPELITCLIDELDPQGIFFTGGNSLAAYGGDVPERDETERAALELAIKRAIPVFGICRGLQVILDYFGVSLNRVVNHVGMRHAVQGEIVRQAVNSYHDWGATEVTPPICVLGRSDDGIVEAARCYSFHIAGVMWHPEREDEFSAEDISMIRRFFE